MAEKLKFLMVEDNPDDCEIMRLHLDDAGFNFTWERVDSEKAYLQALKKPIDLILSDWNLPGFGGLRALKLLNESGLDIPFVIVSGSIGEEAAIDALHQGADDYVLKDRPARLGQATRRAMEDRKLHQEAAQAEHHLRESEAKFRAMFEDNRAVMLLTDHEQQQIVDANPAACAYYGWNRDQLVGKPYSEINILSREAVELEMHQAITKKKEYFNFQHRLADGRIRHVEIYAGPIKQGGKTLLFSIVHDVTERRQRERELEMIAAMSSALRATTSRSEMVPAVLNLLLEGFSVEAASLGLLENNGKEVLIDMGCGIWKDLIHSRQPTSQGLLSRVITKAKPALEIDLGSDSALSQNLRSIAAAPLLVQNNMIGLLLIGSTHNLDEGSLGLLASVADIAASAIHRATLYEQTEERLQQLTSMRAIDEAIRSSFDLKLILNVILSKVTQQLHMDAGDVLLFNESTFQLEFAAGFGFRTRDIERSVVRLGNGLVGRAALERRTFSQSDLNPDNFTRFDLLAKENFVSHHAAPLVVKGNMRGVLEVFSRVRSELDENWQSYFEALTGQAAIAIDNARLFEELQSSNADLTLAYENTIEGWSRALDQRDHETEGHTRRVTEVTIQLANSMGIQPSQKIHMRRGALLHDIGKMAISDTILLKPGQLTPEEWEVMRKHPQFAFELLSPIHYLSPALDIPYCHHEKWDGSGYPRGLKGEAIPLVARIFAVADVWDALTSDRPYREAWSQAKALDYIRKQSGSHFDPAVVKVFLNNMQVS